MNDDAKKGRAEGWARLTEFLEALEMPALEPWQENIIRGYLEKRMTTGAAPRIVFMGNPMRRNPMFERLFFSSSPGVASFSTVFDPTSWGVDLAKPGVSDRSVYGCVCGYSSDCIEGLATHMVRKHRWPEGYL